MQHANKQFSIPNILTILRILMTPFFVILLLKEQFGTAFFIFLLAGISDALDGLIARVFNQRTELGAYLDPIADKLLLASAFISLGILHMVPAWVVVIVITRDILIVVGLSIISLTNTRIRISPSFLSKCTTGLQLVTIALTLLYHEVNDMSFLLTAVFWLTAGLTSLSGLHYIYVGMNILQSETNGDKS